MKNPKMARLFWGFIFACILTIILRVVILAVAAVYFRGIPSREKGEKGFALQISLAYECEPFPHKPSVCNHY